jgi:hypothetical protein
MHTTTQHAVLNHDEIARCAYLLWECEGKPTGRDQEYWFRAQDQLSRASKKDNSGRDAASSAEAASAETPSVNPPAPPVVRRLIAPAALPVADIQLETGRRSSRRKRRATA